MAKDPAFLLYYQDFSFGTRYMSLAAKGAYIDILCHLADKHTISKEHIFIICQSSDSLMNEIVTKLVVDSNGEYYSERLRTEVEKRKSYAKSRRENRLKTVNKQKNQGKNISKSYVKHMEDENENGIEDVNEFLSLEKSEKPFLQITCVDWQADEDFVQAYAGWRVMLFVEYRTSFSESQHLAAVKFLKDFTKSEAIACLYKATLGKYKSLYPEKGKINGKGQSFTKTAADWAAANDPNWKSR